MADEQPPDAPPAPPSEPIPAPPSLPTSTPPPVSEVPMDEERALLAGILPGAESAGRGGSAKDLLKTSSGYGRFVASRMLEKQNFRESALLYHRAKVATVDGASLAPIRFFNELGKDEPNKVVLDACLAVMRGTGIMVDSVPVSTAERNKTIEEDREVASMSPEQLKARVTQRLAEMKSNPAGGSA